MNSRPSPTRAGFEQRANGAAVPPPPPLNAAQLLSPRRRNNVAQPPALTTSLGGLSHQGLGLGFGSGYYSTPVSTTSLSSPFSHSCHTTQTQATGPSTRDTSPMALRQSSGHAVPYNPSQWRPMVGGSPQLGAAQFAQPQQTVIRERSSPQVYTDDSTTAPPPPYSPPPSESASRARTSSAQDSPSSTAGTRRPSSGVAGTISPDGPVTNRSARPRPLSMMHTGDPNNLNRHSGYIPPPPPRSLSQTPADRQQSGSNLPNSTNRNRHTAGPAPTCAKSGSSIDPTLSAYQVDQAGPSNLTIRPPASRRAASTGAVGASNSSSTTTSRTGSRSPTRSSNWEPGMPLPGPPPGPPPSASRSQSASGVSDLSLRSLNDGQRLKARQPHQQGTLLGPVPPTPAGWVDEQRGISPNRQGPGLYIDTQNLSQEPKQPYDTGAASKSAEVAAKSTSGSSSGLFRSSARREPSVGGIRERRSASRTAHAEVLEGMSALSISSNPWADALAKRPGNLDLAKPDEVSPAQSSGATSSGEGVTPRFGQLSGGQPANGSSRSTPRAGVRPLRLSIGHLTQTPPFSPGAGPCSPTVQNSVTPGVPPKALPTPPLQSSKRHSMIASLPSSATQDRAISQVLHAPYESYAKPAPLSPRRAPTDTVAQAHSDHEIFVTESVKRHQTFLEKERMAISDEDKLRAFSDYILAESRLRRRRYSQAWSSGNFDVRPVRERLFEQSVYIPRRSSGLQESTIASPIEAASPMVAPDPQDRPESTWWSTYQPALSPIASMSNNDDLSSRGRTPSRWWESQSGSEGARRVERSKRESKYMGLPRELREAMQWGGSGNASVPNDVAGQGSAGEYPTEKSNPDNFGVYDDQQDTPQLPSQTTPLPQQLVARKLDVSRLVTLPPPYPRHYPAVNNSHPDLVSYRTVVRSVSDFEEVAARRKRYKTSVEALRGDSEQRLLANRLTFRSNVRAQIEDGSISFAEAAEAEEALKAEENAIEKVRVQAEFDSFQDVVLNPLHDLLNERVSQADTCLHELGSQITENAQTPNPNQTQEEGDEQPEVLEKLTQLKWLFEAREHNHREVYALLSERNERFKAIVMLPYQQANNVDKIRDTEAFFARDNRDRLIAFENEVLTRHQQFLQIVEDNVGRGVEMQLSAFWDIAPDLVDVLHSIPEDLQTFDGIEIPNDELEENPSYHQFPLQYLYTLLLHAERSTYQFIESQTNLLCLLHEAKTGVMIADFKIREVQNSNDTDAKNEHLTEEVGHARKEQEKTLTSELKEKVSTIEEQWVEALGSQIENSKQRIKAYLTADGGWDEQAEE